MKCILYYNNTSIIHQVDLKCRLLHDPIYSVELGFAFMIAHHTASSRSLHVFTLRSILPVVVPASPWIPGYKQSPYGVLRCQHQRCH